jgi:hypothetical protein
VRGILTWRVIGTLCVSRSGRRRALRGLISAFTVVEVRVSEASPLSAARRPRARPVLACLLVPGRMSCCGHRPASLVRGGKPCGCRSDGITAGGRPIRRTAPCCSSTRGRVAVRRHGQGWQSTRAHSASRRWSWSQGRTLRLSFRRRSRTGPTPSGWRGVTARLRSSLRLRVGTGCPSSAFRPGRETTSRLTPGWRAMI